MSWYDNKELLSGADVIGWNYLKKKKVTWLKLYMNGLFNYHIVV